MSNEINQIAMAFKNDLTKIYGRELSSLILFGSYARGDFHAESDIDFAVVLNKGNFSASDEIFRISPISSNISIKNNCLISFLPIAKHHIDSPKLSIHRFIKTEGIAI